VRPVVHKLLRLPYWLALIVATSDRQRSIPKVFGDVFWRGRLRSQKRQSMAARMTLLETDDQGLELWATPLGPLWIPAGGGLDIVLAELEDGVYSSPSRQVCVRPGDIVVDCGAHVGAFCRQALRAGAEHVVAIEITPTTRVCLERNLAEEIREGKARVVTDGVWYRATVLELSLGEQSLANTVVEERNRVMVRNAPATISVNVTTLDTLLTTLGLPRVDFIKMDIEGAERQALRGAHDTLQRCRPRMAIAAYHLSDDREAIRSAVMGAHADYVEEFGHCLIVHERVVPETLFFR
jgi:FkbM family methyltransferase